MLRRGRYDLVSLAAKRGGIYWRDGGFNWRALLSLALGMFAAMMWIDAAFYVPAYTGPLSNGTHGADFSWLFGLIVAGVVYGFLSIQTIRKETLLTSEPLEPLTSEPLEPLTSEPLEPPRA
jgi:cytosine/uracil/thiamine/allantoin permease